MVARGDFWKSMGYVTGGSVTPNISNVNFYEEMGFTPETWKIYTDSLASIESKGAKNPYSIVGGANNHYDGKYQMGEAAKKDAAKILGLKKVPSRKEFRKNPALQEKFIEAFTYSNWKNLNRLLPDVEKLNPLDIQKLLAYGHNQGVGGAIEFFKTGKASKDAFGTEGTKYSTTYEENLKRAMNPPPIPQRKPSQELLRPITKTKYRSQEVVPASTVMPDKGDFYKMFTKSNFPLGEFLK